MDTRQKSSHTEIKTAKREQTKEREKSYDRHIGHRILVARSIAGLTQKALANKLGLTFQQIQKYERATNRVSVSRLISIANACGLDLEFFLTALYDESNRPIKPHPQLSSKTLSLATTIENLPSPLMRKNITNLINAIHQHSVTTTCDADEVG